LASSSSGRNGPTTTSLTCRRGQTADHRSIVARHEELRAAPEEVRELSDWLREMVAFA
jgi:hypothetical protein